MAADEGSTPSARARLLSGAGTVHLRRQSLWPALQSYRPRLEHLDRWHAHQRPRNVLRTEQPGVDIRQLNGEQRVALDDLVADFVGPGFPHPGQRSTLPSSSSYSSIPFLKFSEEK